MEQEGNDAAEWLRERRPVRSVDSESESERASDVIDEDDTPRCRCNRDEGCYCGRRRCLRASCVTIPPLLLLIVLFMTLFVLGLAVAFFLTNTTFAVLDGTSGLKGGSLIKDHNNTSFRLILNESLWTYVPSLVPIPVYNDRMIVSMFSINMDSSLATAGKRCGGINQVSAAGKGFTAHSDANGRASPSREDAILRGLGNPCVSSRLRHNMEVEDSQKGAPIRSKGMVSTGRSVLEGSLLSQILLSQHKRDLEELSYNLSAQIQPLTRTQLNILEDSRSIRASSELKRGRGSNPQIHLTKADGVKVKSHVSWPRVSSLRYELARGGITSRKRRPNELSDDFLQVETETWYSGEKNEIALSSRLARATLNPNSLQDGRQQPIELMGLMQSRSRMADAAPSYKSCNGQLHCSQGTHPDIQRRNQPKILNGQAFARRLVAHDGEFAKNATSIESPYGRKRVLASRIDRPRSVHVKIGNARGSQLSWWVSSILRTLLTSCAEEAREASEILYESKMIHDIELGSSCGEQWLIGLSRIAASEEEVRRRNLQADPDALPCGDVGLCSVSDTMLVSWVIDYRNFTMSRNPFHTTFYLHRGFGPLGYVLVDGVIENPVIAKSVELDCATWGYTNVVLEFAEVVPCSWCGSFMSKHSFSHSIFVSCE